MPRPSKSTWFLSILLGLGITSPALGCTTFDYQVTARSAPVSGAVTLISPGLLQYEKLMAPLSSSDSAGFNDALIGLLDQATVFGSTERKVSFQKLFGEIIKGAETPQLVLTQADYNELVAADRVLIKPPSLRECLIHRAADRPRVPTAAYQRYKTEKEKLASSIDHAGAACEASSGSSVCVAAHQEVDLAKLSMKSDPNVAAIEQALRAHARVGMNDPKLRLADAVKRFDTFSKTRVPWEGREGSAAAWLGSGQTPDTIPGVVGVSAQLPPGAMIRTVDPDWLDYELLVASQLYFSQDRAESIIGTGITVPRYIVFLPPSSPTLATQVLGVISAPINTGAWVPSASSELRLPPPRTSMQAQSLLREAALAYASRGKPAPVSLALTHLKAASWEFASLSERYQAAIWYARLSLWQAMLDNIIGNVSGWSVVADPVYQARYAAFQMFRQKTLEAYGFSLLFSPELGIAAPCEAEYFTQLDAVSSIKNSDRDGQERYQRVINSLLALKTRKTVDGQDCTLFDNGGIDRFVGRSHYRIAASLHHQTGPNVTAQLVAETKLSMQFLEKAYTIEPLLPANVDYYTFALLGILTGYSTPENEDRACRINLAFKNTLIPERLETLTDLIEKLREHNLRDLLPDCGKTP